MAQKKGVLKIYSAILLPLAAQLLSCGPHVNQEELFSSVYLEILQGNIPDTLEVYSRLAAKKLTPSEKQDLSALICYHEQKNPTFCEMPGSEPIRSLFEAQRSIYLLNFEHAYQVLHGWLPANPESQSDAVMVIYYRLLIDCISRRSIDIPRQELDDAREQLSVIEWSNPAFEKYGKLLQYYLESLLTFSMNAYTEALIPALAGVAYHENENPEVRFPELRTDLLYLVGRIYTHDTQYALAEHYFKLIDADSLSENLIRESVKTNLFYLADLGENPILRDSLLNHLDTTHTKMWPPALIYTRNLTLGYFHFLHRQTTLARSYFQKAATAFDSTDRCNSMRLSLYNYIAETHLTNSTIDSASYYNNMALAESCLKSQKHREQLWHMLNIRLHIRYASCQSNPDTALCNLASRDFHDQQLYLDNMFEISDPHSSDATVSHTAAFLEHMMAISSLYQPDSLHLEAARIIQASKSRALIRGLSRKSQETLILSSPEYRTVNRKFSELLKTTNSLKELRPVNDTIYLSLWELYQKKRRLQEAASDLPANPHLSESNRETLPMVRKFLGEHDAQLFQFLGTENEYYAVYLNKDTSALYQFSKALVDSCIEEWMSNLTRHDTLRHETSTIQEILYHELLGDHVDKDVRNIIILPDLKLNDFPFEVLQQSENPSSHYLIEDHTVSYHYNLSLLLQQKQTKIPLQKVTVLSWSDEQTIDESNSDEMELAGGYSEGKQLCSAVDDYCNFFSGPQLTVKNFESALNADILHMSTHAFSSSINRLDNYFLLRNNKSSIKYYAYNIPSAENKLSHVVLSACETGTGTYLPGDGVYSISREFLRAGCDVVTKSLWKISDLKTAGLFETYYPKLLNGATVPEALRTAKLKSLRKDGKLIHPYYWAGLIAEGDPFLTFTR